MKKTLSFLLILTITVTTLTSCFFPTIPVRPTPTLTPAPSSGSDIILSNPDGDTWSVFVYICGTDLESQSGYLASLNIQEMLAAQNSKNVSIVFQTGGALEWGYSDIDATMLQRFEVQGDAFVLADQQESASMGDADTLGGFLQWGVENYPADKYLCLLWNHGGGSVSGVCFDELYGYDSLDLDELAQGLSMAGVQFEAVGFDACLMSSLETASAIAPYARYMIGSEEIEPGTGWDYYAWLSYLNANPLATGMDLGITICDTYMTKCESTDSQDMATLSVTELSLIPQLVASFDSMAVEMKGVAEDPDLLQPFMQAITKAENYGGNNENEGYTNMVDLGDLVRLSTEVLTGTSDQLLADLADAVKYKVGGFSRLQSTGLSVFAPLSVRADELDTYANVAVSGNYLRYLEGTAGWIAPENLVIIVPVAGDKSVITKSVNISDCTKVNALEEENFNIEFYSEVLFNNYYLTFTKGYDSVTSVMYNLYFKYEDSPELYYLGSDYDVNYNDSTMVVWDNFRNVWPLINGNICSMVPVSFDENFILYTVPIVLNGSETNLRMTYSYIDNSYTINGIWDGIEESGMSSKEIYQLVDSDVIEFLFMYVDTDTEDGEVDQFTFGGFTVAGDITVEEAPLFDCTYFYEYEIEDIFGRTYTSDFAQITVLDGVVTVEPF